MEAVVRKTVAALRHPAKRAGCTRTTLCCDFWNWGPNHVRPDCCTEHIREVLFFVEDLLTKHGIKHWLDFGTLLGAARDESFIPWDDDADVGVLASDRERLLALKSEIAAAGYSLDARRPGDLRINYSRVNSAGVDLFMWSREGDRLVGLFDEGLDWPGTHGATSIAFTFLEPGGEVRLYGREFPAPAPLDEFLRARYGDDYMTPFRGVRSGSRWCPPLTPDEMTPAATTLFARASERESVLLDLLCRSRLSRLLPWQLYWLGPGLPRRPAAWALAEVEATVATGDRTPAVEGLIRSLAILEQAIAELERPARTLPLRRSGRRAAWFYAKTLSKLTPAKA